MTYPLIDITRPVRLTKFGMDVFSHPLPFDTKIIRFKPDEIYSIKIRQWSFTKDGKHWSGDQFPSIENIPEETKMVDWTKEVIDLETGEVMRVLCTDSEGEAPVVMLNKNKSLRCCKIDGTICGKPFYGNRKPDSEPPSVIAAAFYNGFTAARPLAEVSGSISRFEQWMVREFKKSQTYKDWKNKIITVEDVK